MHNNIEIFVTIISVISGIITILEFVAAKINHKTFFGIIETETILEKRNKNPKYFR